MLVARVEVVPEAAGEEDGVLGDDREAGAELVQPQPRDVHPINTDPSCGVNIQLFLKTDCPDVSPHL